MFDAPPPPCRRSAGQPGWNGPPPAHASGFAAPGTGARFPAFPAGAVECGNAAHRRRLRRTDQVMASVVPSRVSRNIYRTIGRLSRTGAWPVRIEIESARHRPGLPDSYQRAQLRTHRKIASSYRRPGLPSRERGTPSAALRLRRSGRSKGPEMGPGSRSGATAGGRDDIPPPSCPDLFRASPPLLPLSGRMDTRNKSGYDDMRGGHDGLGTGTPGAGPGPDPAEPLETCLNPSHALCPQNPNRTAVDLFRA